MPTCAFSGKNINFKCPVTKCWANFKHLTNGCIFIHLGRTNITQLDLSIIYNTTKENIIKKVESQKNNVALYVAIDEKIHEIIPYPTCPDCGIIKSDNRKCIIKDNCRVRQEFYKKQTKKYPIKGYKISWIPSKFYNIIANEDLFHKLVPFIEPDDYYIAVQAYNQVNLVRGTGNYIENKNDKDEEFTLRIV